MHFTFGTEQIEVNVPTRDALMTRLTRRFQDGTGFALATINLDHMVKLAQDTAFLKAYQDQDFVVADGRPVVWLSKLAGQPVELMPGSDLVIPLTQLAADQGVRIGLVGSSESALTDAANTLKELVSDIQIIYTEAPEYGFDPAGDAAETILAELQEHKVGLCFLALGAPKQECFAALGRSAAPSVGFVSVGAGLDFLGGHQRRAPTIWRKVGLEWLWRALSDPSRMVPRYLKCFGILPGHTAAAIKLRNRS